MNQEFNQPSGEVELNDVWLDETDAYEKAVAKFLTADLNRDSSARGYDGLTELHFSGGPLQDYGDIKAGKVDIKRIKVFYVKGKINNIHVVIGKERDSNFMDIYISGKALNDLLETIK